MFVKKFLLLFLFVTGCIYQGMTQVADVSGVYKGSLFQGDESYTFNVTMTIKQEGKSVTGTFLSESTGKSKFFVVYNIAGVTDGKVIQWKDVSVANERSSGTWFWCIKVVRATVTTTRGGTLLSCDWKNDGGRMFFKKLPVQNKGAACSPGSFKLLNENGPRLLEQDTLPVAKEEPKVTKTQDTTPVVKAKPKAKKIRDTTAAITVKLPPVQDTTPLVKVAPKAKRQRDSASVKKERKPVRDTVVTVTARPQVQDTTPVVKAEPKRKRIRDSLPVVKAEPKKMRDTTSARKVRKPARDTTPVVKAPPAIKPAEPVAEVREIDVKQRIEIISDSLTLYFYDNGVIDNDTISVYYNNALLVSQQRLSYNPVTITVPIRKDGSNELVMFANNEGEVPPNSALLVFTDNKVRREITMVSTLKRSGSIVFTKK